MKSMAVGASVVLGKMTRKVRSEEEVSKKREVRTEEWTTVGDEAEEARSKKFAEDSGAKTSCKRSDATLPPAAVPPAPDASPVAQTTSSPTIPTCLL